MGEAKPQWPGHMGDHDLYDPSGTLRLLLRVVSVQLNQSRPAWLSRFPYITASSTSMRSHSVLCRLLQIEQYVCLLYRTLCVKRDSIC